MFVYRQTLQLSIPKLLCKCGSDVKALLDRTDQTVISNVAIEGSLFIPDDVTLLCAAYSTTIGVAMLRLPSATSSVTLGLRRQGFKYRFARSKVQRSNGNK